MSNHYSWLASWIEAVGAIIGAVGTGAAFFAALWAIKHGREQSHTALEQSRVAVAADLVFRADEKFGRMRKERQEAAECLLAFKNNSEDDRADEVMDFFDTVGLLIRRKILDEETAWSLFYWWAVGYWEAAQKCDYVEKKRGEYGEATWEDFEVLYNAGVNRTKVQKVSQTAVCRRDVRWCRPLVAAAQ